MGENWGEILRLIPGYDPYESAGDCWFDEEAAELACGFFPDCLRHVKGEWAGTPIVLEPWQKAIIGNLFGWKRPDGMRRYRTALLYLPRKNAKTTLAAGIVVFVGSCDGEAGAEIYSAAADREQAQLVFVIAREMILAKKELKDRTQIYKKAIVFEDGLSSYKSISADAATKHGYNAHLVVVDELHAQPNSDLVEVLETSQASRRQPLMIYLTTADFKRESICNSTLEYACKVRDGKIEDESFLPVIYAASEKDDWKSEDTWRAANPNYGISVKADYIKRKCKKAEDTPRFENTFKRLHLNIQTDTDVKFFAMDRWDSCTDYIGEEVLAGRSCYAGFDLATNTDIAGYVLLFPWDDEKYVILPRLFIPKDNLWKRVRVDKVPYDIWATDGHLTITPGNAIDYSFIKESFWRDAEKYKIEKCAFDRWGFEALRQQFISEGVPEDMFIAFGQGYASMSAPMKALERIVLAEKLIHNGHPILKWMASNTVVMEDARENIAPNKKKSPEKIDGIVMTIMALGLAITQPPEEPSVYEGRGMLIL